MQQVPRKDLFTVPYTFTSARVWPVQDSTGVVHRTCGVWEPSPLARVRTICERADWTPVELMTYAEGQLMVTCIECLGRA